MKHKKYTNTTRKSEFIKEKIKELHEDAIFLTLDKQSQDEIIDLIKNTGEKNDNHYNLSQIIVYGLFLILIFFLIINVYIDFIHIQVNVYLMFFAFTLGAMLLVYAEQKKNRCSRVSIILQNWEDMPESTMDDFILVVKQEIESSHNSPLGKLFFSKYTIYAVYLMLLFLFIKVVIEDREPSLRLFTILYLDLLVVFFFQNPIYVFDQMYINDPNYNRELLELYEKRILENYKKSIYIIVIFFVITFFCIAYNIGAFSNFF